MHRREHQERELGSGGDIGYLELYIANLYRPAFVSACFLIQMKNRLRDVDYGLLYKQSTFLTMIGL